MGTAKAGLQSWDDYARWIATRKVVDLILDELVDRPGRTDALVIEADDAGLWDDLVECRGGERTIYHQVKGGLTFGGDPQKVIELLKSARRLSDVATFALWIHDPPTHGKLPVRALKELCRRCRDGAPPSETLGREAKNWLDSVQEQMDLERQITLELLGRIRIETFENVETHQMLTRTRLSAARMPAYLAEVIHARLYGLIVHGNISITLAMLARNISEVTDVVAQFRALLSARVSARKYRLNALRQTLQQTLPADPILRHRGVNCPMLSSLILPTRVRSDEGIVHESMQDAWDGTPGSLIFTGEGGAGKSVGLKTLAAELANRIDEYDDGPFPVFAHARVLATCRDGKSGPLDLSEILGADLGDNIQILLLVDGLDELTPHLHLRAEECLRELLHAPFVKRMAVTSRPFLALRHLGLRHYVLLPWSVEQVDQFTKRWAASMPGAPVMRRAPIGGNPLTVTLACAYQRGDEGLIHLLRRVSEDVLSKWNEHRLNEAQGSPSWESVEDFCLHVLIDPDSQASSTITGDRDLARVFLASTIGWDQQSIIPAGARPLVEFLAAESCVRRNWEFERLARKIELIELAKMAFAVELEREGERARERLQKAFSHERGLGAFQFRLALLAANACVLHGPKLPSEITENLVKCLWRYVICESSTWKSPEAARVLGELCRANLDGARTVRNRVEKVVAVDGKDATEVLAKRYGFLHNEAAVRISAMGRLQIESVYSRAWFLITQMFDDTHMVARSVAVEAALGFRGLPRGSEIDSAVTYLRDHCLRSNHQILSAAAAAALLPGEAPMQDHAVGLQRLVDLRHCPNEVASSFLDHPGGREAAAVALPLAMTNGVDVRIGDPDTEWIVPREPIAKHSDLVQGSCWSFLVPSLPEVSSTLADSWKQRALQPKPRALSALIMSGRRQEAALESVLRNAAPGVLIFEPAVCDDLAELLRGSDVVYDAFLDYLARSRESPRYHDAPLRALEPLLCERHSALECFISQLPQTLASPLPFDYHLPTSLLEIQEISTQTRVFVRNLIEQVDGTHERKLNPASAAKPLVRAGWLRWEHTDSLREKLAEWLGGESSYARLVGLLASHLSASTVDALLPTVEEYLNRTMNTADFGHAEARAWLFRALPPLGRIPEFAVSDREGFRTASLAAAAHLCRCSSPEQAAAIAGDAAARGLHYAGFTRAEDSGSDLLTLVAHAPEAWFRVGLQQAQSLFSSIAIFNALFEVSSLTTRSELAQVIWDRMSTMWTPYRMDRTLSMKGRRPSDVAEEWLFRYADETPDVAEG